MNLDIVSFKFRRYD